MKNEVYNKLRALTLQIDDLNTSAENISNLTENIRNGDGEAKFFVYVKDKGTSTTELSKTLAEKICTDILEYYHDLIRQAKKEINKVIENAIDERLHSE